MFALLAWYDFQEWETFGEPFECHCEGSGLGNRPVVALNSLADLACVIAEERTGVASANSIQYTVSLFARACYVHARLMADLWLFCTARWVTCLQPLIHRSCDACGGYHLVEWLVPMPHGLRS
jgi:hypothetical protein